MGNRIATLSMTSRHRVMARALLALRTRVSRHSEKCVSLLFCPLRRER